MTGHVCPFLSPDKYFPQNHPKPAATGERTAFNSRGVHPPSSATRSGMLPHLCPCLWSPQTWAQEPGPWWKGEGGRHGVHESRFLQRPSPTLRCTYILTHCVNLFGLGKIGTSTPAGSQVTASLETFLRESSLLLGVFALLPLPSSFQPHSITESWTLSLPLFYK